MADTKQRTILKVKISGWFRACSKSYLQVFRQHGHSMGPDSIELIEDILDKHDIPEEDIESSTEWIAREYSRQDGEPIFRVLSPDPDFELDRCWYEGVGGNSP